AQRVYTEQPGPQERAQALEVPGIRRSRASMQRSLRYLGEAGHLPIARTGSIFVPWRS
ncbi:hypothetical protein P7K49_009393, partial [Saguinus oedipus]